MFARSAITAAAAGLALAAFGVPAAPAAPAIPLNSGQEADAGEAGGHGFFTYSIDGTEFCWTLSWKDIAAPTAAHIHLGRRHVAFAGNIVIPLFEGVQAGSEASGCTTQYPAVAAAINADPRDYYVNVHNDAFGAGAIRGQLK